MDALACSPPSRSSINMFFVLAASSPSPSPVRSGRLCALALAAALLVAGCSSSRETTAPGALPEAFPSHSVNQIRANLQQQSDTLRRFAASARVTVRSPERDGTFDADIRQRRADSLYMSFRLFGIEGARMLVTPDSFFFYDKRQQQMVVGPVSQADAVLPLPVSSNALFQNLLGFVVPPSTTNWEVAADSAQYYLTDPSGRQTVVVDPTRWRVVRYARRNASGTVVEERLFTDYMNVDGVAIPQRIIFRRPEDDALAMLRYRSVQLNPTDLSFALDVSDDVPRVSAPATFPRRGD